MKLKKIICTVISVCLAMSVMLPALAEDKKETVYVMTDGTGAVKKVIISEKLNNEDGEDYITDISSLKDITNVSGDESYTDLNGQLVWKANGNSITYEGATEELLPVNVNITYTLDGKSIQPEVLKGKSGHLVINIDYESNVNVELEISGEKINVPRPFIMLSGMIIDPESMKNLVVTNGKVVDIGSMNILFTWGVPGIRKALGLEGYFDEIDEIFDKDYEAPDMPESAMIECDVEDFSLSGIYTIASGSLLEDIAIDEEIDMSDCDTWADDVDSLMSELMDGALKLRDGAEELKDGALELRDGAGELSDGLNEINENSADLVDGAKQVFEGILDTANSRLQESKDSFDMLGITLNDLTVENFSTELDRLMDEMLGNVEEYVYEQAEIKLRNAVYDAVHAEVVKKVREAARQLVEDKVREGAETMVREQVEDEARKKIIYAITNMDEETLNAEIDKRMADAETQAQIDAAVAEQMATPEVQAMIENGLDAQIRPQVEAAVRQNVTATVRESVVRQVTAAIRAQIRDSIIAAACKTPEPEITIEPTQAPATEEPEPETTDTPETEEPAPETTDTPETEEPAPETTDTPATEEPAPETTGNSEMETHMNAATAEPEDTLEPGKTSESEKGTVSTVLDAITASAEAESLTDEQVEILVDQQMASEDVQALIRSEVESRMESTEVQAAIEMNYNSESTQQMIEAVIKDQKEANREAAVAQAEQQVRKKVEEGARQKIAAAITNMDEETLNAAVGAMMQSPEIQTQINANVEEQMKTDYVQGLIKQNIDEQMASDYVQSEIRSNIEKQMGSPKVQGIIADNIEEQRHGSTYLNGITEALEENGRDGEAYRALAELKDMLDDVNTFYQGVMDYTDAVGTAAEGAVDLAGGTCELYDGSVELSDGMNELYTRLNDFCTEQGEKLTEILRSSVMEMPERANAVLEAIRDYRSFAGIPDEMTGTTRFIFHTTY